MGLNTWEGSRVRKADVIVAKNYLASDEIDALNRLVVIFLEQAELRVMQRRDLTLDYWQPNVDRLLAFNDRDVLQGAGAIRHDAMTRVARERYDAFDAHRRREEAIAADADDLRELQAAEKALAKRGRRPEDT